MKPNPLSFACSVLPVELPASLAGTTLVPLREVCIIARETLLCARIWMQLSDVGKFIPIICIMEKQSQVAALFYSAHCYTDGLMRHLVELSRSVREGKNDFWHGSGLCFVNSDGKGKFDTESVAKAHFRGKESMAEITMHTLNIPTAPCRAFGDGNDSFSFCQT